MKAPVACVLTAMLLSAPLAACSDDKPAVCTSADNLETAVEDLKDVDVTASDGVSDVQDKFGTVRSNLEKLKSDAKSEFSSQIEAVDAAVAALKTSIDTAVADPTAANLSAVGAAAPAVSSSAKTLVSDVKSTC